MRKEWKHFTPEEKVAILRRHLVNKLPVSELCEELGLRPTMFYRWQKELFENGPVAILSGSHGDLAHCIYRGFCIQGCNVGAKATTLITHVPDALKRAQRFATDA
jgi:transposase-like protein